MGLPKGSAGYTPAEMCVVDHNVVCQPSGCKAGVWAAVVVAMAFFGIPQTGQPAQIVRTPKLGGRLVRVYTPVSPCYRVPKCARVAGQHARYILILSAHSSVPSSQRPSNPALSAFFVVKNAKCHVCEPVVVGRDLTVRCVAGLMPVVPIISSPPILQGCTWK